MVCAMQELLIHLPDHAYERLVREAAAAQQSPEQWLLDRLLAQALPSAVVAEPHTLLAAALDALGFQRLAPAQATRLSALLEAHQARPLLPDEADDLHALMTEADTLELESLQRLATAVQR